MGAKEKAEERRMQVGDRQRTDANDYFDMLRGRYEEFREAAPDDQLAVMRYYTYAGHEIRVGHVYLYEGYTTLLIQGDDGQGDQPGNPCEVIVHPHSAQVVLRYLPREGEYFEGDRRPVGFTAR
jgi:hypothetical protein